MCWEAGKASKAGKAVWNNSNSTHHVIPLYILKVPSCESGVANVNGGSERLFLQMPGKCRTRVQLDSLCQ